MADDDADRSGTPPPWPDPSWAAKEALEREISHLREYMLALHESHGRLDAQKFESIEQRFRDRDLLTSQAFDNVSEATDAALTAAKEAVDKSEKATKEQLAAIRILIDAQASANAAQIGDLKERLGKSETRGSTTTQLIVIGISAAAVITAIISVVLSTTAP